ncbi:MAG: phosphotransferase [Methyloprofundus sp.]|nr:phosphotransferase [Methyloprofundus sp.]
MAIIPSDDRSHQILSWLKNDLDLEITQFEPASSDASFRRYFRISYNNRCFIVMDAPPEKEDTQPFINVAELFNQAEANVPDIIAKDMQQGFLLLQDFGAINLLDRLNESSVDILYRSALKALVNLQNNVSPENCFLPYYTPELLKKELNLFSDWFLHQQCHLQITNNQLELLNKTEQFLIESACQQKQVCVHRDFHSRNLMHIDDNNLGIIDFQDAVIGPITYDAVSLLRDCYIAWPEAKIDQLLNEYFLQLQTVNLVNCSYTAFKRDFDLMGIQRHLKAIGIFSRLNIRDGKSDYLADIPRTLNYVIDVSKNYPELKEFHHFLRDTVLVASQSNL